MPVTEKTRIAATAVTKNALGMITVNLLLFMHLNKRVALNIKKR